MIRGLLGRERYVPIGEEGLNRVISVNTDGGEVKVRDLIAFKDKGGDSHTKSRRTKAKPKPVGELNEHDKEQVVTAYLNSIPRGRAIAISGYGSFTADTLKDELRKHSRVAEEITDAVLRHSRFIEQAINDGRVRLIRSKTGDHEPNVQRAKVRQAKVEN